MCNKPNDGTVVGAHCSGIRSHELGKGTGQKCTDAAIAYICHNCHVEVDQYKDGNGIAASERFLFAVVKSHDWLLKENILK